MRRGRRALFVPETLEPRTMLAGDTVIVAPPEQNLVATSTSVDDYFAAAEAAYQLDSTYGLSTINGIVYENLFGHSEKWLHSPDTQSYFFVMPMGDVYQWTGSLVPSFNQFITHLDPIHHYDPSLLYWATDTLQFNDSEGGFNAVVGLPAVEAAREAARRTQNMNQLRQIGLSLLYAESSFGELPVNGSRISFDDGTASEDRYSWRVHLLKLIDPVWFDDVRSEIKLMEGGSDDAGQRVAELIHPFYVDVRNAGVLETGYTNVQGVFGHNGAFAPLENDLVAPFEGHRLSQFTDGKSHTIVAVMGPPSNSSLWYLPGSECSTDAPSNEDVLLSADSPNWLDGLLGDAANPSQSSSDWFLAVYADGHVAGIDDNIDTQELYFQLNIRDGGVYPSDWPTEHDGCKGTPPPVVDIDADSDNRNGLERSPAEEQVEDLVGRGVQIKAGETPAPVLLNVQSFSPSLHANYKFELTVSPGLNAWANSAKTARPTASHSTVLADGTLGETYVWTTWSDDKLLYIEGAGSREAADKQVHWRVKDSSGNIVARDTVRFQVEGLTRREQLKRDLNLAFDQGWTATQQKQFNDGVIAGFSDQVTGFIDLITTANQIWHDVDAASYSLNGLLNRFTVVSAATGVVWNLITGGLPSAADARQRLLDGAVYMIDSVAQIHPGTTALNAAAQIRNYWYIWIALSDSPIVQLAIRPSLATFQQAPTSQQMSDWISDSIDDLPDEALDIVEFALSEQGPHAAGYIAGTVLFEGASAALSAGTSAAFRIAQRVNRAGHHVFLPVHFRSVGGVWDNLPHSVRSAPLSEGNKGKLRTEGNQIMSNRYEANTGDWEEFQKSVHHAIQLEWAHLFPDLNPNEMIFVVDNALHTTISNAWRSWKSANPNRTRQEVIEFAKDIHRLYGDQFETSPFRNNPFEPFE